MSVRQPSGRHRARSREAASPNSQPQSTSLRESRRSGVAILATLLLGCGGGGGGAPPETIVVEGPGASSIRGEVWADNWFAFYLGDRPIVEDSVSIGTERSFNAEAFVFNADYPLQLNFVAKDFKENDTGLEYIGRGNQQMGDGGLIAQFTDTATWRDGRRHERRVAMPDDPRGAARPRLRGRGGPGGRRRPVRVRSHGRARRAGGRPGSTTANGRRRSSTARRRSGRRAATTRSTGRAERA